MALDEAYLLLRVSLLQCLTSRFIVTAHSLPIPPYVQFSRIRRSDSLHRKPCAGFATYSSLPLPI